jgi:hypothetical protein
VLASSAYAKYGGGGVGANYAQTANMGIGVYNIGTTPYTSYSTLGEAYIQAEYAKTKLKIGRQLFNSPLAGADSGTMIPNLFQGAVLTNTDLPSTKIIAAYFNGFQGGTTNDSASNINPQTSFSSISRSAFGSYVNNKLATASPIGDTPMYLFGVSNNSLEVANIEAWYYNNLNAMQMYYLSSDFGFTIASHTPYLSLQYYGVSAYGSLKSLFNEYAQTLNAQNTATYVSGVNYNVLGAKLGVETPLGLTPEVAVNAISGKNASAYFFNAWGGTPNYSAMGYVGISSFTSYGVSSCVNPKGATLWNFSLTQNLEYLNFGNKLFKIAYGYYDFLKTSNTLNSNALNTDVYITDIAFMDKGSLVKNLEVTLLLENIKYANGWQNLNQTGSASATASSNNIIFLRGIYKF